MLIKEVPVFIDRKEAHKSLPRDYQYMSRVRDQVRLLQPDMRLHPAAASRFQALFHSGHFSGDDFMSGYPDTEERYPSIESYILNVGTQKGAQKVFTSNGILSTASVIDPYVRRILDPSRDHERIDYLIDEAAAELGIRFGEVWSIVGGAINKLTTRVEKPAIEADLSEDRFYYDLEMFHVHPDPETQIKLAKVSMDNLRKAGEMHDPELPLRVISWLLFPGTRFMTQLGFSFPPGQIYQPDLQDIVDRKFSNDFIESAYRTSSADIVNASVTAINLSAKNIARFVATGKTPEVGVMIYPQNEFFYGRIS